MSNIPIYKFQLANIAAFLPIYNIQISVVRRPLNLGNGFWGHFWPRGTKTRLIFLIGQSYSTMLEVFLTNTNGFQNKKHGVFKKFTIHILYIQTPGSNLGVKFDPKTFSVDPLPRLMYTSNKFSSNGWNITYSSLGSY